MLYAKDDEANAVQEISTRRVFLQRASLYTVGALTAINLVNANHALAAPDKKLSSKNEAEDAAILNTALALEYQGIAAYQIGAESGLLQKPVLDTALKFQGHHKAHADVLASTVKKLGSNPVSAKKPSEYGFPLDKLKTQADVLRFAAGLEHGATRAYLGAVPVFHSRDLAKAAASIMGDEAMHWAILLNALGEDPVPIAFIG